MTTTTGGDRSPATPNPAQGAVGSRSSSGSERWRLGRTSRNALLSVHIAVSVGLLGDSMGFLAVAIRRAMSDDQAFIDAAHDLLRMFALAFGIPLSFLALLTGVGLGLGTRWGVFRYPWVIAKLALIVSVIIVGATVIRPVLNDDAQLNDAVLVGAAGWDVAALALATGLAVFKPGRVRRGSRDAASTGGREPGRVPEGTRE
jgi:hypothetical protein